MPTPRNKLVICIENDGYPASLEKRKVYIVLPDQDAEHRGLLRVIDESGDDYVYPRELFRAIELAPSVKRAVLAAT